MTSAFRIYTAAINETARTFGITSALVDDILEAHYSGQELDPGANKVVQHYLTEIPTQIGKEGLTMRYGGKSGSRSSVKPPAKARSNQPGNRGGRKRTRG